MERHKKRYGVRMDKMERDRKREARKVHKISEFAQKSHGIIFDNYMMIIYLYIHII